ncbi:hypothetical protein FACS189454_09010 [Planctomycetales bacterium]|nr:hypothetical protein FACS189454_09010 [Planctomycetales bacterium]
MLRGSTDFTLLAWGLFGLVTLGPARLVIPMYLFTAWGSSVWLFWMLFYFITVRHIARSLKDRTVVYHCQREKFLPALFSKLREIDPKTEWRGNVLSMFGCGLQWAVSGMTNPNLCLVFLLTEPQPKNPNKDIFYETIRKVAQTV